MTSFVGDQHSTYPYSSVVYITATFPSGLTFAGTGAVVGENDVLTASHVVYSDENGGLAEDIVVFPARDGPLLPFGPYDGDYVNYYEIDQDNDGLLTRAESEYDLAMIGFDTAFGNDTGWFDIEPGQSSGSYNLTGYPEGYNGSVEPRMTNHFGYVTENLDSFVFDFQSIESLPGHSGGPLWASGENGPSIAGVLSTRSWAVDVSGQYYDILNWMDDNDFLLESNKAPVCVDPLQLVQRLYIGFYGRPADPKGQRYWAEQIDATMGLSRINDAFAVSREARDYVYSNPGTHKINTNEELVNRVYHNLFSRDADNTGLQFYTDGLEDGVFTLQSIVLNVIDGARGKDFITLQNKVEAAEYFTSRINQDLYGSEDIRQAREVLQVVDSSPASLISAKNQADALIREMIPKELSESQSEVQTLSAFFDNEMTWLDAAQDPGHEEQWFEGLPTHEVSPEHLDLMGVADSQAEAALGTDYHS
ncbi:MAG: DUF4214 domain-containing protein [Desulfohalobiaceae bacterium]|nr:DUF4214 domain-containing protein [Desulfohalobiaceae bacterium]